MTTLAKSALADAISLLAYQLWDAAGRPENCDQEFWLLAEHELKAKPEASCTTAPAGNGTVRSSKVRKRRMDQRSTAKLH